VLASTLAFLIVLAIRNLLQALLGRRWFERVSSVVQTALIVLVTSALLLLPAATPTSRATGCTLARRRARA